MKRFTLPARPEPMANPLRPTAKPCKPLQIHLLTAMPIHRAVAGDMCWILISVCMGLFRAM